MPEDKTPNEPEEQSEDDEFAGLLQTYGDAINNGDTEAAKAAMAQVWAALPEMMENDEPSPWLVAMGEAHECEARFDWEGAENAYRQGIEVTRDEPTLHFKAHQSLSSFYRLLGRKQEAFEHILQATAAARKGDMGVVLGMALVSEVGLRLAQERDETIEVSLRELFALVEDTPRKAIQYAQALILRARYGVIQNAFDVAEADLERARELIMPWENEVVFAGWQAVISSWWGAKARLQDKQGDLTGAVAAWREAVHRERIRAQSPMDGGPFHNMGLAAALFELGRALEKAGDPGARYHFQESRSLRHAAGLPALEEL